MKKKYVIIGSSAAGMASVSTLLRTKEEKEIICISKQQDKPYNKCLLTAYLANKKIVAELGIYNDISTDSKVEYINQEVTKIDRSNKIVILADKQVIKYDKLLLACGAEPFVPDKFTKLLNLENVFLSHTKNDYINIKEYIKNKNIKSAILLGAGLTGIETADALLQLGIKIHLIDINEYILPKIFDSRAANWLTKFANNFKFFSKNIEQFVIKNGLLTDLIADDGIRIGVDLLIISTGTKPNIKLALDAALEVDAAIVTDTYLRTSDENIFAAGDCTQIKEKLSDKSIVSTSWPDAIIQGMICAENMMGKNKIYEGLIPFISSCFAKIPFVTFGKIDYSSSRNIVIENQNSFITLSINQNEILEGFLLMGSYNSVYELKKIVANRQQISLFELERFLLELKC